MKHPLRFIFIATLIVSGVPWAVFLGYSAFIENRKTDPQYTLKALMPRSVNGAEVKDSLWPEILDLSIDSPKNLYALNLRDLKQKIRNQKVFEFVNLKKLFPATLFIEYKLKEPVFELGNQTNTLLDREGTLIPAYPFFTPKNLTRLYIPESDRAFAWGSRIDQEWLAAALKIQQFFDGRIGAIDLQKWNEPSFGEREIVLQYQKSFIRLNKDTFFKNLTKYFQKTLPHAKVIDLRIDNIALLQE